MKLIWLLSIPLVILFGCRTPINQNIPDLDIEFTIEGNVDSFELNDLVILNTYDPVSQKSSPVDTGIVDESGRFGLWHQSAEPGLYRLQLPNRQSQILAVSQEDSKITVKAEGKRNGYIEVSGSEASAKIMAYDEFRKESNDRLIKPPYAKMREATKAGDKQAEIEAVDEYVKATAVHRTELIDYSAENMAESIALYYGMLRWTGEDQVSKLSDLVNRFETKYPYLTMTKVMKDKVERYAKVAIGTAAPNLVAPDTSGNMTNLHEFTKDKVVLIDFWASWCRPCLLQIPDLKEAYNDYKAKGFEIVGVSVDRKIDSWKKTIKKYEMDWPHMSDVKGWQSDLSAAYNVTFIPYNVVIDQHGVIVAKNVHDKDLRALLDELLTQNES